MPRNFLLYLGAVAKRSGFWGPPGTPGVSWGNLERFKAYVASLDWFLPAQVISPVAWVANIGATLLALGLLIGWKLHWVALASALLLLSFTATVTGAFGVKASIAYSVFTAATGALLLFPVQAVRITHASCDSSELKLFACLFTPLTSAQQRYGRHRPGPLLNLTHDVSQPGNLSLRGSATRLRTQN